MPYHRPDVVARALEVLDDYGLADLSMRRLAAELDVRPSALYHHFPNKQALLAAVADTLLERGFAATPVEEPAPWDHEVAAVCQRLRDAMLAYRDGAELVATVHAYGVGAQAPAEALAAAVHRSGLDEEGARVVTRTLLHFVFGHTGEEQAHLQAASAGAIDDDVREDSDFHLGLELVLAGVRQRVATSSRRPGT